MPYPRGCRSRWLPLLVLLLSFAAHGGERRYYFDAIGSERGLASHTVSALLQDHTGFVWIATQGGLYQYDGYRYRQFQHASEEPNSLPESFITALAEDAQGRIWVGGIVRGLAALDPVSGKVVASSQAGAGKPDPRDAIGALLFDPARGLWIGTAAGIEFMDVDTGTRHEVYRFAASSNAARVFGFATAADGSLWSATSIGLLRIAARGTTAQPVAAHDLPSAFSIAAGADGSIYAGGRDGVYRVDVSHDSAPRFWPEAAADATPVRAIAQDHDGRLWLSTFGSGLAVYDPATHSVAQMRRDRRVPGSLPDDYVSQLLVDRSGLLWVGTQISGVAIADPQGAQFRYVMDAASERNQMANMIRAISEDSSGRLWLGTEGDGLKRYDPARDGFEYFDDVLKSAPATDLRLPGQITALAAAGGDKLWVATNRGAFLFDPLARRATPVTLDPEHGNGLPDASVRTLLAARDGSVWFGTFGKGLAHSWPATAQQPARWEIFRHGNGSGESLAHDLVVTLYQDDGGRIWIGTLDGLSVYEPSSGHLRTFRHDPADAQSLADNLVRSLYQSGDGALWIGTQSGLDRVDIPAAQQPHFVHYSTSNGLPSATVYGILEDAQHNIWMSTGAGIATFNRALGTFRSFTLKDGLQGLEFNGGASFARANGELVFGGLHGINVFRPETLRHDAYLPPVVITATRIGSNADLAPITADGISMAQAQRVVRFEFAALDYAAPERNRFVYRLRGFDPEWIDTGTRHEAVYTNLPAGSYEFEVRAANADGVWNQQGTSLALQVTPVWWATNAMKALYIALASVLLALLFVAYRRRHRRETRHNRELREREDRLRLALWGSGDEFWDWDMRKHVLYRIGADQLIGGQREETLSAEDWRSKAVHPDDLQLVEKRLYDHVEGRSDFFESEHRIRNTKGDWIWVLSRAKVVERDAEGKALRVCGTARNITAARAADSDRRIAGEVIASMSEAVAVTDLDFRFVSVNQAFTRMTGYTEADCLSQNAGVLNSTQHPPEYYLAMRAEFVRNGHWRGELWQRRKDGEEFLCWLEISTVRDASGQRTHYVGVMADITDRKRAEQELRYLANYDTLTGLPNRTLLGERLAHAVIRARRTAHKVAVLFLDLDRFKHVNDSMGHATGDRVLKAVGERLRASVRETATVARLGGDEFTVVLEDVQHIDDAQKVASELLEVFTTPLVLDGGQHVVISPSIGISLYPDHAQVPTDLLKYADTAMYQAKEEGRNVFRVYTPAMDAVARQRAGMVSALRLALERNELRLVYQPMLQLSEGRIAGVEALLRWSSAEFGEVNPTDFIPLAEEAGLIERIGEFVLFRACAQLREWQERGLHGITMSVNLSALQLLREELTQRLCEILAELDLDASHLELELTESVLMEHPERAIHTLDRLHALGVSIAIDDFGTGYSSLSYLKRLPIDTLKIDRSFVGDITSDPDDEAITKTIITMAHSLDLEVVAEGVETLEQLEYLHEQGCDAIQGHWLSPPLDAAAAFTFVREFERSRPSERVATVR
jgi:diguanylate cyclase (GGDEF)-like protein/PAS domain S-box-containing protein